MGRNCGVRSILDTIMGNDAEKFLLRRSLYVFLDLPFPPSFLSLSLARVSPLFSNFFSFPRIRQGNWKNRKEGGVNPRRTEAIVERKNRKEYTCFDFSAKLKETTTFWEIFGGALLFDLSLIVIKNCNACICFKYRSRLIFLLE